MSDVLLPINDALGDALENAPRLVLSERQRYDLEMLLVGGFAPLTGFLPQDDYHEVVSTMRLKNGTLWPMPIVLDVAGNYKEGDTVVLTDIYGTLLAALTVTSVYSPDKQKEAKMVYGTTSLEHPGVRYLFEQTHNTYVGGTLTRIALPSHSDFLHLRKTPEQLKEYFAQKNIQKIIAFQTRNPVHRAHFELMRQKGSEHDAHVLLHPVVGPTKDDDINYQTRVRSYEKLYENRMRDFATLSLLPLAMRMAGPREALWHALIRKNYGATHFIVGRDHAGPGKYKTGEPFYGLFDAEKLVKEHEPEIGIHIIAGGEMVYVPEVAAYMPLSEVDKSHTPKSISGTEVRRMLRTGEKLPEWFSFPETEAELRRGIEKENKNRGVVIFLTGLSGAGKSTIARSLQSVLEARGVVVTLLDGDVVRQHLSKGLGFSKEDRNENVRRIGFVAAAISRHGGVVICSAIAPYGESREDARKQATATQSVFIEIYVATELSVCIARDVKGLYRKAEKGLIHNVTGIDDPYEIPLTSEISIDTEHQTVEESVAIILQYIDEYALIPSESAII